MYNFTSSLAPPLLGVDICSQTPRTPEILNSLIAMTNPLEYSYPSYSNLHGGHVGNLGPHGPSALSGRPDLQYNFDNSSLSSSSSRESPGTTPISQGCVQQTRSALIKAGVKLLIQNKRKHSSGSISDLSEQKPPSKQIKAATPEPSPPLRVAELLIKTDDTSSGDEDSEGKMSSGGLGLTPEDEDRRRRRRERNKIAATKCRMKKRERTINLVQESEILETQNVDLKNQVKDLESQKRKLGEMLRLHGAECGRSQKKLNFKMVDKNNNLENKSVQIEEEGPGGGDPPLPSLTSLFSFGCEMFDDEIKYSHTFAQMALPSPPPPTNSGHAHSLLQVVKNEDLIYEEGGATYDFDENKVVRSGRGVPSR